MKIRNINRADYGLPGTVGVEAPEDVFDKSVVFKKTLTTLSKEQHERHLSELVGEIDKQAQKLAQRADIKEFEKYRSLIRDFIDEIVSNGYSFSKDSAFGSRGRHRIFATVQKIDEKLEALAKDVLEEQSDNIEILHKIDDIRGLILDMML